VRLLKAEATASVSVMRERNLGLMNVPSEGLAPPARAGRSGRPPPKHLLSRQERSLEPDAMLFCIFAFC